MLSEKKVLLRLFEAICVLTVFACLYMAYATSQAPDPDFPVFSWGTAGMASLMLTFLPACMLGGEYVKTVKKPSTWRQRTEGLNAPDITAIVRWAPKPYKAGAGAAVVILVFSAFKYGQIRFSTNAPIDTADVPGLFLYLSVFLLLALPILGSAARMQGSYAANSEA